MALIAIPPVRATGMTIRLLRGDAPLEFFSGAEVIVQSPKAVWLLSFPLVTAKLEATRAWAAALVQLSKLSNTFQVAPPAWPQGSNYVGANPLVVGAANLGLTLPVDGASNSTTIGLAGDFFTVNGEFKMLTASAVTNGAGAVTLAFEPALRAAPPNNALVEIRAPLLTLRLVNPLMSFGARMPDFFDTSIEAIESFGP